MTTDTPNIPAPSITTSGATTAGATTAGATTAGATTASGAVGAIDVSILIVSYRTRDMTLACLRSIFEQTRGLKAEVILVDNASGDGTAEAVAAAFPQVRLLAETRNHGFAGGNNLAAQHAAGRYLLLLNPDTLVLDGAVQKMWAFAQQHPEAGVIGGRTFYADGSLNPTSCWGRPTLWSMFCRASGLAAAFRGHRLLDPESLGPWRRDTVREVDIVTGCLLLIRADLWRELGGFDPTFFMYGEDADLCLRVRARKLKCLICPEATIVHYRGASEPVRVDKIVRLLTAKALLFRKHWGARAPLGIAMLLWWVATRVAGYRVLAACGRAAPETYRCWRDIWTRRREWAFALSFTPPTAATP